MEKVWVPIRIDRSTSLIMAYLELSIAFTIKALGFNETPFRVNFINVHFGMTFKEDLVSTNTRDRIVSKHFIETCKALFCALPLVGSSPLLKPKKLPAVILTTTPIEFVDYYVFGYMGCALNLHQGFSMCFRA